jgi:hypothetical protein
VVQDSSSLSNKLLPSKSTSRRTSVPSGRPLASDAETVTEGVGSLVVAGAVRLT